MAKNENQNVDLDALKSDLRMEYAMEFEEDDDTLSSVFDGLDYAIDDLASRNLIRGAVKQIDGLGEALKFFEEGVKAWKLNNENPHGIALFEAARAYSDLCNGVKVEVQP